MVLSFGYYSYTVWYLSNYSSIFCFVILYPSKKRLFTTTPRGEFIEMSRDKKFQLINKQSNASCALFLCKQMKKRTSAPSPIKWLVVCCFDLHSNRFRLHDIYCSIFSSWRNLNFWFLSTAAHEFCLQESWFVTIDLLLAVLIKTTELRKRKYRIANKQAKERTLET